MRLPKLQIYTRIFIGLISGVLFGIAANSLGFSDFVCDYVKPVGTAFIKLISMIVVPLVFASLLVGTASLNDIRKLGRIGGKTLIYYLCTTVMAIAIGLFLANVFKPGTGISEQTQARLLAGRQANADTAIETVLKTGSIKETLLGIIPKNPVKAFAEGNMLQIIFFAIMFGVALTLIGNQRAQPVIDFFQGLNDAIIRMVHLIMKAAPYGVFALIAGVVSDFGLGILFTLLKYALVVIGGLIIHSVIVYGFAIKMFSKLKVIDFFKGIRGAILIAFSSGSSSAALPVTMECAEKNLGVASEVCSFALPLGATINMDGTALYQGVSAVFIAQVFGMDLTIGQQLTVVLAATLAAVGTAGAPGVGMIMLAMVLTSIGVPLEGIALVLGPERILDMCRTAVNVTGDAACAVVVDASEGRSFDNSSQRQQ